MKIRLFLMAWLLGAAMSAHAASDFDTANEQFGSGRYEEAARGYHLALDKGIQAAEVYYNLGLAETKAGKVAEASLSFQRALTLNPALEPARRELLALSAKFNIEIPEATWVNRLASAIPRESWWIGGAVVAWLGAFIILGGLFARARRGTILIVGVIIFIFGKAALGLAWTSDPLIQNQDLVVLVADGPNRLRSAPVDNSETIASLAGGSTVALLSERGKWAYCASLDGKRGWVERSGLQPVIPRKPETPNAANAG